FLDYNRDGRLDLFIASYVDLGPDSADAPPPGSVDLDYDQDGWPDIYVACDSAPSILLHNSHDGTFQDVD
ncbi:MAG: FG-GAP-like repeat-containing protein, partial [Bryobacteraceae bacterium]